MKLFTQAQLMRLWMIYLIAAPLAFMLRPLYQISGYEGWIAILTGSLLGLLFTTLSVYLAKLYPGEEWGDYGPRIVGRAFHWIFSFALMMFCLIVVTLCATNYTDLFVTYYLPETPDTIIAGVFLVCVCLAARSGIGTITLMSDGFFLLVFGAAVFVIPLLFVNVQFGRMTALATHWSAPNLINSTLFTTGWLSELFLFFLISPYFKPVKKQMRRLVLSQAVAVIVIVMYWLLTLLLFGPSVASQMRYPLVEVVRFVSFGEVLENLDPILIGIWSATLFMKSALLLFVIAKILSKLLGLSSHKPLVSLIGSIVFLSTHQYINHPAEFSQLSMSTSFNLFVFLVLLIPGVYGLIAKLRFGSKPNQPAETGAHESSKAQ